MDSLNYYVREYTNQLSKGQIQKAYKGIMIFMSGLSTYLAGRFPDYIAGNLYFGYIDMTFFAFTPSALREKKLKIAIVYLVEQPDFDHPEDLKKQIEERMLAFVNDINSILNVGIGG